MHGLIYIGIKRRLLLPICMKKGDKKSPFICLLMMNIQGTSPTGADIQGS